MVEDRINVSRDRLAEFCQRWKIAELAIFGSVLTDAFRPESDIDVLVTFEPEAGHSLFELADMEAELAEMFGRPVDLVEKAGLRNPFRRHRILETSEVVYAAL
jgi:predicted nucleotidyltransferase